MDATISEKSSVARYSVGLILGMMLQSKCKSVITSIFGERFKVVQVPHTNVLANVGTMSKHRGDVGHSTNGYLAIEYLIKNKLKADKVMLFTDCQLWDSGSYNSYNIYGRNQTSFNQRWKEYKAINPTAKLYLFDLAGYGNAPVSMNSGDVYLISGWSDRIFGVLNAIEQGGNAVAEIEKVQL